MTDIVFTALTKQELEAMFDKRLELAFQRHAAQQPAKREVEPGEAGQTYVSKRQAARLLDCSPSTVDNAARAGKLRRHYVGKSVRFLRSEVLGLAKSNTNHKQKSFNNER